jgi:diguanylate cyclase (GGDEF)-like protein/PAS domain S-box-containing protein
MLMDAKGHVLEANDAVLRILGYSRGEFKSQGLDEASITPPQFQMLDQWMQIRLESGGMCPAIEKEFIRKDGCHIPVLVGVVQLSGTDRHRLCFVIDVTERRTAQDALRKAYDELEVRVQQRTAELQEEVLRRQRAEEELQNQAIRDPLTSLYNRRGFMAFAENQLQLARRQQVPLLLFMGDLDDLKKINDQFGHAEGDYALTRVSEILHKTFRQSDVIARIGGDEFAMVGLEEPDHTEGSLIARLQQHIDDYNRYSGRPYRIRLSIGVSQIAPDATGALEQMMQQADAKLYEQKKHKDPDPIHRAA